jgi:hypothetical protein
MIRKILFAIILLAISVQAFGQDSIPAGGYLNLNEYKNRSPKYSDTFTLIRRTTGDIKAWGGNDYKVESSEEQITKKILKNEIWGIQKGDTLYLNALPITGLGWYSKVEISGRYSILHPAYPINGKIIKELGLDDPQSGLTYMFGAIGGAIQGAKIAMMRIPLIYDMETNEKMLLTEKNVIKILENYPNIKSKFNQETTKPSEGLLTKYLEMINEQSK